MKLKYTHSIFWLVFIFVITACQTDETCRKSRIVETGLSFYLDTIDANTGRMVETEIIIDSLTVIGIGADKYLYEKAKIGSIKLPLNQFANVSKFSFKMTTVYDTITVIYKNQNEFLSLECGSIRTHTIDTVYTTGHFIDSITVLNPIVNTSNVKNIKLHHIIR